MASLAIVIGLASSAIAQNRVLHVWVDPHSGDDTVAMAGNAGPGYTDPLAVGCGSYSHPHDVVDGLGAPLLHASLPFRTVTAAVAYIQSIHPGGLPMTHGTSGITTMHVIIHCLPGIYSDATSIDSHTGLELNGETFPILLPESVSLQGTSGLNTLFTPNDPENAGTVFQFGSAGNAFMEEEMVPPPTPRQFVANISVVGVIRDAEGLGTAYQGAPEHAAAIFVDNARPVSLLITNCFFYCNAIGLLVDALQNGPVSQPNHSIHLVNNTFAWNVCGIWNGQIGRPTPNNNSVGLSILSLVNNVIDTTPPVPSGQLEIPLPGHPGGARPLPIWWSRWVTAVSNPRFVSGQSLLSPRVMTNLEGVDLLDVDGVLDGIAVNFNAYDPNRANESSASVSPTPAQALLRQSYLGLGATTERTNLPTSVQNHLRLDDITSTEGSNVRGILFVRDLVHEGARGSTGPSGIPGPFLTTGTDSHEFDLCVGDFRLSPGVRDAGTGQLGQPPTRVNPMVDSGFDLSAFALQMGNGQEVTGDAIVLGEEDDTTFPHMPRQWDVEGWGNPRVFDHPEYPGFDTTTNVRTYLNHVDIGADELGQLVMIGYREGTTIFMDTPVPDRRRNDFQWYLCPSDNLLNGVGSNTVSQTSMPVGPWHTIFPSIAVWDPTAPGTFYSPFATDTTPYLLPDIHPWHFVLGLSLVTWEPCVTGANWFLYLDPLTGIINPVGTFLDLFSNTGSLGWEPIWLDTDITSSAPGPWMGEVSTPPWTANVVNLVNHATAASPNFGNGGWCFLTDTNSPNGSLFGLTHIPPSMNPVFTTGHQAMRISCEWRGGDEPFNAAGSSNLQSFMILVQ